MSGMLLRNKKECLSGSDTLYNSSNNDYCSNDYYPLFNKLNECYKNENKPDGYYLISHIFQKCIKACLSCNEVGETENIKYTNCDNNKCYYEYLINSNSGSDSDEVKQCVLNNTLINNYYFYSDDFCLTCDASSDLEKNVYYVIMIIIIIIFIMSNHLLNVINLIKYLL